MKWLVILFSEVFARGWCSSMIAVGAVLVDLRFTARGGSCYMYTIGYLL